MNEKTSDKLYLEDKFYDWELSPFMVNNDGDLLFLVLTTFGFCFLVLGIDNLLVKSNKLKLIDKPNLTCSEKTSNLCKELWVMLKNLCI